MALESINPANGERIAQFNDQSEEEIDEAIVRADKTYDAWRKLLFADRAAFFIRAAELLRAEKEHHAKIMAQEMGKPITAAEGEAEKCAWVCEHFAEHAAAYLADEPVDIGVKKSFVTYRPLGVLLAVMPWNFPYWQVFRCAAPNLMAGNTLVLKHASNVTQCALAIEDLLRRAGFPEGAFQALRADTPAVRGIIEHPRIQGVALTGSTKAGKSVGAIAGGALKRAVLELGGSDPFVVLADADLDLAAKVGSTSRLFSNGQSCIAAKRFIVVDEIREAFVEKLSKTMGEAVMGDPLDRTTTLGPLARPDLRDTLHKQVQDSIAKGAECVMGGKIPSGEGAYYPPTILTNVRPGMAAYEEELFGPVAAVIGVRSEAEALRTANDTCYGLGATVCTEDRARGEQIATNVIESGACFVNGVVRSDPRLPFGGVKSSGIGRELGRHGIQEFVNAKTVVIE